MKFKHLVCALALVALATAPQVVAQEDTTPPVLVDFQIFPLQVDTSSADQNVTVVLEVTDNLSGVESAGDRSGSFRSPSGVQVTFGARTVISEDFNTVRQSTTVTFPRFSQSGLWKVSGLGYVDRAGNRLELMGPQLAAMGFDISVEVVPGSGGSDIDGDNVPDIADNCPSDANSDQADRDLDFIGDACDPFPDDRDNEKAQCLADLSACLSGASLMQCQSDLTQAQTALTQCQNAAGTCTSDLATCTASEAQCTADLGAAQAALSSANANLAQCSTDLSSAQAALASANTDSDQDGRRDVDDACANTTPGADVDTRGCSLQQFCATFDATMRDGRRACKRADWQNDEPAMRSSERDCAIDNQGAGRSDDTCVPAN